MARTISWFCLLVGALFALISLSPADEAVQGRKLALHVAVVRPLAQNGQP